MSTFTSSQTSHADVATRVLELEAVVQAVIDKLADLSPPEGGDVSELTATVERLYKVTLRWSQTGSVPSSDPTEATIFDSDDDASLYQAIFSSDPDYKSLVGSMSTGASYSIIQTLYQSSDTRWTSSSASPLGELTYGTAGTDYTDDYALRLSHSLSTGYPNLSKSIYGSVDNLAAVLGTTGTGSLVKLTYGTASGDPDSTGWIAKFLTKSFARRVFGTAASITTTLPSILEMIIDLQDRVSTLEDP